MLTWTDERTKNILNTTLLPICPTITQFHDGKCIFLCQISFINSSWKNCIAITYWISVEMWSLGTITINTTLASFIEIYLFYSWMQITIIPIPLSDAFLSPLQYVCLTPCRPVHDDKFVKPLDEHTCLIFCLQARDWAIKALK